MSRPIKLLLACVLLATLLWSADWARGRACLELISGPAFIFVIALLVIGLVVSTWKWSCALQLQALTYPFPRLFRALCGGFFLNNFLPTSVGGDAYRIYRTLPADGHRFRAVAAVAIERGVGLAALIALGAVGAAVSFRVATISELYLAALLLIGVAGGFGVAVVARKSSQVRRWLANRRQSAVIDAVVSSVEHLAGRQDAWIRLIGLSFAFQAISISVIYFLFRDIGIEVSWLECALIAALVGAAGALPISINGIGVAEGALVGAALALGVGYDEALIVAILRRMAAISLGVLCGFLYAFEQRFADSRRPLQAEDSERSGPKIASGLSNLELLEHVPEAIVIWELRDRSLVYWNHAAELLYGYARDEVLGRHARALLKSRFEESADPIDAALATRGVWVGDMTHTARGGSDVQVQAWLSLLRQQDGRTLVLEASRRVADASSAEAERMMMARKLGALTSSYST